MSLSKIAIRRPVTTTMFFIAIVLLGIVSFRQLPVQLVPDLSFPGARIYARYQGASLEDMLENVTKPLEAIASSTPRVREIESYTRPGRSYVNLHFEFGTDMRFAILDLQEKVIQFRKTLPRNSAYVSVYSFSTERMQNFLMDVEIRGAEDRETVRAIAEDLLLPQLEAVDGVAEVDVGGYYRETIDIVFDRDKLTAHDQDLGRAMRRIQDAAVGEISIGRVRGIRTDRFLTLGEIVNTDDDLRYLPLDDTGIIRLNDVAHVFRYERRSDFVSRKDGENFSSVYVNKEAEANPMRVAVKVRELVEELKTQLPPGYTLLIDEDAAKEIEKIINQVGLLAVFGGLLAMVVLVLFVRNLRMSLVVFTAIPISIVTTFNLMYFGGLSLNIITLIGLALGIGMLVDNAIVVLENVFRHFEHSGHALEASENATNEVWRALLATTLTNVIVFTPILFTEGPLRIIFGDGALAIIFPVAVSLLVALTLVPMLTARILVGRERRGMKHRKTVEKIIAKGGGFLKRWYPYWPATRSRPRRLYREFYMMILRSALKHRFRVVLFTGLAIYMSWTYCIPMIGKGMMSQQAEGGRVYIFLQLPQGSTMEQVAGSLDVIEGRLLKMPIIEKTRAWGDLEDNDIMVCAYVKDKKDRPRELRDLEVEDVSETIIDDIGEVPNVNLSLRPFRSESSRDSSSQVSYSQGGMITVKGAHWEALESVAQELADLIELVPGVATVEVESSRGDPELQFTIDRRRAALFNITAADLQPYFQTSQRGGTYSELTMERGDRELAVRMRMGRSGHDPEEDPEQANLSLKEIRQLEVMTPAGGAVPLAEIGHFREEVGERSMARTNSQFATRLTYMLEPRVDRKIVGESVKSMLKEVRLLPGYSAEIGGEEREIDENLAELRKMLKLTLLLVYMVMASVFESLLAPLVILLSLPLAGIGVLWGLALSGASFDQLAMLGVLVLAGIVVNNGIVMMDFIMMLRRERNFTRTAAIITACRARLRPILMTTLTTILGLLPMALRTSEDIEWSGLAIVIICGLAISAALTLIVVPVMLIIFEDAWALVVRLALWVLRQRWVLYFFRPSRMRAKRLALAPAGIPTAFSPTFAALVERTEAELDRLEATVGGAGGATLEAVAMPRKTGIEIRNVRLTYPVFRVRKALHVIPSTHYKYGVRPPEGVEALRGVDLNIEPGVFGLLGPNGAGKTSLMKIITGLIQPTCGYVGVNELNVATEGAAARAEIGYLPQSFGLHGPFTAREYLDYYSLILDIRGRANRRRNVEAVLEQVDLTDVADDPVGTFSGGMKQRVGIARLLLTVPRVIIVDEPTAGLDPIERVKFRILLSQLATDRVVLLSTHIIDDISSSCGQLAVIHEGRVVYDGSPAGLIATARGRIWEWTGGVEDDAMIAEHFSLLYKKAAGKGRVLYRFIAEECSWSGARMVEPSLEDAYVLATAKGGVFNTV